MVHANITHKGLKLTSPFLSMLFTDVVIRLKQKAKNKTQKLVSSDEQKCFFPLSKIQQKMKANFVKHEYNYVKAKKGEGVKD